MCDTLVALPDVTADGSTILAKNSDREPNEAQAISFYPRQQYGFGTSLRCTYITIPQVSETFAVLLSRPFWMWGAEMGANEHGVVIGNEAVFSKVKVSATGLTGMDLLRLGLERGASAREALSAITDLLEAHGQGGSGGYQHRFYYHNSFILADRREAWVLETVDRHWAARRVRGYGTISNGLTIGGDFDLGSDDLVPYAMQRHWCRGRGDFHVARAYSDLIYTRFSACRTRQPYTSGELGAHAGCVTPATIMTLLRTHGPRVDESRFRPAGSSNASICMHFGDELVRSSQTAGSMVAHLRPDGPVTVWLTGTAAPCLSLFKPFYLDASLPDLGPVPEARYDPAAIWWQGERLHRAVLLDYRRRAVLLQAERDELETDFVEEDRAQCAATPADRAVLSARCAQRAAEAMRSWTARVDASPVAEPAPWLYRRRWEKQNQAAGMRLKE